MTIANIAAEVPIASVPFEIERARADFPVLQQEVHGKPLVYLDNAATMQKPRQVTEAIDHYYRWDNANIHRAVHQLSERATQAYEAARNKVQHFINAARREEIVFVRGTTEAINLVAQSFGRSRLQAGDEILLSHMEHHSNIVPWQLLCEQTGAVLKVVPIDDTGELLLDEYERCLSPRTRLVAMVHASNVLGTINPAQKIIELAHARGIPVLLDGAQTVPHMPVDVQELDCDFYAFSAHKMVGPTGIGVLYGKREWLEAMPPYQGGGDMILSVSFDKTLYSDLPYKFEAGTPHIAGAIGLGVAIDYLETLGMENIAAYEQELLNYGTEVLAQVPGLRFIGTAQEKVGVLSFVLEGVHPHDIGTILDHEGIAIRTGHHCAQPVMERFNIPATARASLAFYNTKAEMDVLAAGIKRVGELLG
ncbi:cysteine desulfurase [Nitrosococcus oceani]|uniref:Cysteine desulfurase n=2 Tax=Nitrosococcus oceani TaxID=1229 RepID=Q3J8A6_NITOC|nr:cysteine desulfurase [Nitrosococcus oceani]KFI18739.1 cysteine sulfinate desulfinase [Nitrosococcus oceani C-27]ABA58940.1 L-selenocysteine selenide-lyase (L-alanine-forming) / cysteine desulfurase [Nitrosococcus oceani ATCC 19707]EDZ68091.1 cysteine desulfurase, SufS subfamily [Nitrosococcus oceani AFC27]KFI21857.1 cysteine sulfinate desulfinase [Nitrosococcus oceani]GEM18964.1 cysteine desulfurase [Nitrosococcus oceani]